MNLLKKIEKRVRSQPARAAICVVGVLAGIGFLVLFWDRRDGTVIERTTWLSIGALLIAVGIWTLLFFGSKEAEESSPGRLMAHIITTVGIGLVVAIVPIILDRLDKEWKPKPKADVFFHNHDLVVLTGYAMEQTAAEASVDPTFDSAYRGTLSSVKGEMGKEFESLSDDGTIRRDWPELTEDALVAFLGKDSPESLTVERWSGLLSRMDTRLGATPDPQHQLLAQHFHDRFPDALHEALKDDFADQGKAWAGMELLMQKHARDAESKMSAILPLMTFTVFHQVSPTDRRVVRAGYGHIKKDDQWWISVKNWQSPHDYMLNIAGNYDVHVFDLHGADAAANTKDGMLAWLVGPPLSETLIVFSSNAELSDTERGALENTIGKIVKGQSLEIIPKGEDGSQVAWDNAGWRIVADEKGVMGGPALTQKSWPSEVSEELNKHGFTFTGRTMRVNPPGK